MNSIRSALASPWRQMIVVNAALMLALFIYKVMGATPVMQHAHLIVDYHFGFAKRALIGALIGLALPVVPVWFVYVLGGAVWALTTVLFIIVFRSTFGFSHATLPLFVFVFGSPFFLKNFLQTIGYFDIYGCALALVLLLVRTRTFAYVIGAALGCAVLILIHPIHMLLYVPTIGLIVILRYYLSRNISVAGIAGGFAMAALVGGVFVASAFFGRMNVPPDQLMAHMRQRGGGDQTLDPWLIGIWYRTIATEIELTWNTMPANLLRLPVYAALIALHWPLIRYFKNLVGALANVWHRRLTAAGIVGVSLGYVVIGVVVFDYSRWFSSWAVCMFLVLHAVKTLPALAPVPLIADDRTNRIWGWLVTVVPRVGTTKPF